MPTICEPSNYDACTVTVTRLGRARYRVEEHHRHDGARSYCPLSSFYDDLSWEEVHGVVEASIEARRPGMSPEGWEQQILWD